MTTLRQQINLYQPEAEPQRGLLGADTLRLACTAMIAAFLAVWVGGTWQVDRMQRGLQALEAQQQHAEKALGALGAVSASSANSSDTDARIRQLEVDLAARERALALLQGGSVGRTSGFSLELAALAQRPVAGLWLQRISLSAVTNSMSLAGEALEPDLVPRYLRELATERELSGLRFDRLVIEMKPPHHDHARSGPPPFSAFAFQADGAAMPVMKLAAAEDPKP